MNGAAGRQTAQIRVTGSAQADLLMGTISAERTGNEIAHGRKLSESDPVLVWGWGTPAGRRRAQRRTRLIAEQTDLKPGIRALEIGCGTGLFTEMFSHYGASLVALDISAEMLERARLRGLVPSQVEFLEGRVEEYDSDRPFDAVIGSSVLHHLEVEVALRKIHTMLRPGGKVSLAEPNMLNPQVCAERKLRFLPWFWHVSPDETAFVRCRLRALMLRVGFEAVSIQPFDWLHPATPRALIGVVERLGILAERMPLLKEFSGSLLIYGRRPQTG